MNKENFLKHKTWKLCSGEEAGDPGMVLQTIRPSVAIISSHTFSNAFQSQLETFNLDLQMFQHLKLNGASHTMNQQKTDLTFYNWKRVNRLGSLVIISCNLKPLCSGLCDLDWVYGHKIETN